jgi:hypothetical protein
MISEKEYFALALEAFGMEPIHGLHQSEGIDDAHKPRLPVSYDDSRFYKTEPSPAGALDQHFLFQVPAAALENVENHRPEIHYFSDVATLGLQLVLAEYLGAYLVDVNDNAFFIQHEDAGGEGFDERLEHRVRIEGGDSSLAYRFSILLNIDSQRAIQPRNHALPHFGTFEIF